MAPHLSVVIPAYNRRHTIDRTVTSVLAAADALGAHEAPATAAAGPRDTEVIVVDDGSVDDTGERAHALARGDGRVRVLTQPNAGVSAARNHGAARAEGEVLVFVDCDDRVLPHAFTTLVPALDGADLVFAAARAIAPDGAVSVRRPEAMGPAFFGIDGVFLPGMFALRRSTFAAIGGYAVPLAYSENTELGLRLVAHLQHATGEVRTHATHEIVLENHLADATAGSHAYSDRARFESALYLADVHGAALATRDPDFLATYWSVAGVAAARLGRSTDATRCFLEASRLGPRRVRHLARAAVSLVPPLRRRAWPRRDGAAVGDRRLSTGTLRRGAGGLPRRL